MTYMYILIKHDINQGHFVLSRTITTIWKTIRTNNTIQRWILKNYTKQEGARQLYTTR